MANITIIKNRPAIVLGGFFATVTAYVLFNDVIHGAAINTSHVLSLAALVAAIASGHFVWPQLRSGAILAGLMLGLLALSATTFVVVSSSARNADVAARRWLHGTRRTCTPCCTPTDHAQPVDGRQGRGFAPRPLPCVPGRPAAAPTAPVPRIMKKWISSKSDIRTISVKILLAV